MTRAVSIDGFNVSIRSVDTNTEHYNGVYSALPSPLKLPVGNYTVRVQSAECPDAEWESVCYAVSQNFEIKKNEETTLDGLVCKISNILVSVRFSDYMKNMMGSDCAVEVRIGNFGPLSYDAGEERRGGFRAEAETNTLVWDFKGTLDGEYYHDASFIQNVKGGEHRTLTFNAEKGDVEFDFTISVECTTYDMNLNVDVTEDVIEPFVPSIAVTSAYSLTERNTVRRSDRPLTDLGFIIDAEDGISSLKVEITTDNEDLAAEIASRGITGMFDLASPGALESVLQGLGFPTGAAVSGKTQLNLDISQIITMTLPFGSTDQVDVQIWVSDPTNYEVTRTLRMRYVDDSGPYDLSVVWKDYDITQKYTFLASEVLYKDENDEWASSVPIRIDITASNGIAGLVVEIISENPMFGEDVLTLMGLAARFDLVNPDNVDPNMLMALGFPVGDDVRDETSLSFDITIFLPLIFMVSSDQYNEVDFKLTVTDNDGNVEVRTIQLKTIPDISL